MRTAGLWAMALLVGACGTPPASTAQQNTQTNQVLKPLPKGSTLLTGIDYSPEPDTYLWIAGRSPNDLWIGSTTQGVLHRDGGGPEPVAGLTPSELGGVAGQGVALATGELLLRVTKADGSSALVSVVDGTVADRAADFGGDAAAFAARFVRFDRTPDGQAVAVLRAATGAGGIELYTWRNGHFQQTATFTVPGDPEKARVYPTSPVHGYVLGPDANGGYAISRFDASSVTEVIASQDQLSAPLWPTAKDQGFLALSGLKWFDGQALVPAAGTDAAASFPFGPDGLASLQLQIHDSRPRATIQHGPTRGVEVALGDAGQRVLASGLVGRWFVVLMQPGSPKDPSLAAVNVDAPPRL